MSRVRKHVRNNIVGYVALFFALTMGGAWAAGLAPNSVKSKQIKAGAVKNSELADGAVDSRVVRDDSLTGADVDESSLDQSALPAGPRGAQGDPGPAGEPGRQGPPGENGSPDTAAQVLAKLSDVDGSGSGLDADSLDGLSAASFVQQGGPAGGDLTGTYPNPTIGSDAVGAAAIANPTRAVNLPLPSFVDFTNMAPLDGAASNGTAPDFIGVNGHLLIEWDEDVDGPGGVDTADVGSIGSTFTVPPDFASGGTLALRVSKDGHAGGTERFNCNVIPNDSTQSTALVANLTSAASTSYAINLSAAALSPGDSVSVKCGVNTPGSQADDKVRLESVEWRYVATQ